MAITQTDLIGRWNLISYTATDVTDPQNNLHPLGAECAGDLEYRQDGCMQVKMTGTSTLGDFEGWWYGVKSDGDVRNLSYKGPYRLEDCQGTTCIFHQIERSRDPHLRGQSMIRHASLQRTSEGVKLILSPPSLVSHDGGQFQLKVTWAKVTDTTKVEVTVEGGS